MKIKNFIIALLLLFSILPFAAYSQEQIFQDSKGNTIRFSDYRGKWVVINYWASWCPPCIKELPELNALYRRSKQKNIILLGVNYDLGSKQPLAAIIKKMKVEFPTLTSNPATTLGFGNLPGIPATYIIAPNGKFKTRLLGPQTQQSIIAVLSNK